MSGTVNLKLPPPLAAQTGLPQTITGTLEVDARSVAIAAEPLRSHHEGHMKLKFTDGEGKESLADVNINVSGIRLDHRPRSLDRR
jgi:hypothetical protein